MAALNDAVERVEMSTTGSRHDTLFASAAAAGQLVAGRELTASQARTELVDMGRMVGLSQADVDRTVDRGLAAGAANPRSAPVRKLETSAAARREVLAWWAHVAADPALRTRTGTTTRRVLAAFALLSMAAGTTRLSDSYRQLAEVAGVSPGTITKHLPALAPYVRRAKRPQRDSLDSTEWQLILPDGHSETPRSYRADTPPALFPDGHQHALDAPGHNFWHRRSGWWAVWCALDVEDTASVDVLAETAGRSVRTVRRVLGTFARLGLVEGCEGAWCRVPDAPEPVCEVDHAAVRRDRHAAERAAWCARVARVAADREAERERVAQMTPAERDRYRHRRRMQDRARRMQDRARRYERRRGTSLQLELSA